MYIDGIEKREAISSYSMETPWSLNSDVLALLYILRFLISLTVLTLFELKCKPLTVFETVFHSG